MTATRRRAPGPGLVRLEQLRWSFGPEAAAEKRSLVLELDAARLGSAAEVERWHELLCLLRAYPDDAVLLAAVERALAGFARRPDLARQRAALADTGIAGTVIHYRFFYPTALWLAQRWPGSLRLDPQEGDYRERLRAALPSLVRFAETMWVRSGPRSPRAILARLAGGDTSDGSYFVRRIAAMAGDSFTRESYHDAIDVGYRLDPDPAGTGPSRTHAHTPLAPLVFRTTPPRRERPDLALELTRPPRSMRRLARADGLAVVDLARAAMVTRKRDLDAFCWGNPDDVRLIDDGDGLAFAFIGMQPERRSLLPAVHGALTLRNGVPTGYIQTDTLMGGSELSFNTFATFRGGEASFVLARLLAALHHLFGCRRFRIEPYQLGHHNEEGLASGAWWFYWKLGFRPTDPAVRSVMDDELRRMARDPGHRSPRSTLERLARGYLYWPAPPALPAWDPPFLVASVASSAALSRFGSERERGERELTAAFGAGLGVSPGEISALQPAERLWLGRLSPLLATLPGLAGWPRSDRRDLLALLRAKAGRDEYDYVRRFDAHPRLAEALRRALTPPAARPASRAHRRDRRSP